MDVGDTFVFIFSIVDGISLLFLTVYFVSLIMYERYDIDTCKIVTGKYGSVVSPTMVKAWT